MPKEKEEAEGELDEDEEIKEIETNELWASDEEDAILESNIEFNLMKAESTLSNGRYNYRDIMDAIRAMVFLKNNVLIKYQKEREKGPSEELRFVKWILVHFEEDPQRRIRDLNKYIFPILGTKYAFGLKHKKQNPWERKEKDRVLIFQKMN